MGKSFNLAETRNKYQQSRYFILLLTALTTINVFFILLKFDWMFYFSAFFPQLVVLVGQELSSQFGSVISIVGYVFTFLVLAVFVVMYFLSKKSHVPMLIMAIIMSLDCLLLILVTSTLGILADFLVMIIFQGVMIGYFFYGFVLGEKLKAKAPNGVATTLTDIKEMLKQEQMIINPMQEIDFQNGYPGATQAYEDLPELESSPIIKPHDGKGVELFSTVYRGHVVVVIMKLGYNALIVDGNIYAEKKGFATAVFDLQCTAFNCKFRVTSKPGFNGPKIKFFVNDEEQQVV